MKVYKVERLTTASPERVWQVWSDPSNWSTWNTGIRSCRLDGPLQSGATAEMETSRGSKHCVTFHDVEPGRGFSLTMDGPPLTKIVFVCAIEPTGPGSTISQGIGFTGPLSAIFGPLLGRPMSSHFVPVLDDLAATAEQTP